MGSILGRQRFTPSAGSPVSAGYPYTANSVDSLHTTISSPRLTSYLQLSNQDRELAVRLYAWNTALSESLYSVVQCCEVTLRNAINDALSMPYGDFWFDESFMRPDQQDEIAAIRAKAAERKKPVPTAPDIIAGTTMGFWTGMLDGHYETNQWIPFLRRKFVNAPKKTNRANVEQKADRIRGLRNRIAHHEPILSRKLQQEHKTALEIIRWICSDTAAWAEAHSNFDKVILKDPRKS